MINGPVPGEDLENNQGQSFIFPTCTNEVANIRDWLSRLDLYLLRA